MSRPTRDLCELILMDSAKLQEEDAYKANLHHYTKHRPAKPLYTIADVEKALKQFVAVKINQSYPLHKQISFQLFVSGHIPGACAATRSTSVITRNKFPLQIFLISSSLYPLFTSS